MWLALATSESGDDYVVGPFEKQPTRAEILDFFKREMPEEGELMEEVGTHFKFVKLSETPAIIDLQR